jgi:glycosyltransferase involved in cell wall biosynthesis
MIIGYYGDTYTYRRNIIGVVPHLDYIRIHDLNDAIVGIAVISKIIFRRFLFDVNDRKNSFNDWNFNRVDILHFFNSISYGRTPWITTFETIVPRFKITDRHYGRMPDYSPLTHEKQIVDALEVMSSKSCKRLIALSKCNLNMQKEFLSYFHRYCSDIEPKLTHLYPPQETYVDSYESKHLALDGPISFVFVGRAFFRKGGMEIIETLSDLRNSNGYNIKLSIVSSMGIDNYATKENAEDVKIAKEIIDRNRDWIDYYSSLPNKLVIALASKSHVGLLPTYADTFGYSVIEFQACGCPVISTNVRALPEINNNEVGWLIEIPKNHLGEAIYTTEEDRTQIKMAIKKGLEKAVIDIFSNKDTIPRKADAALERIRNQHSPENYSMRLGAIYNQALS